MKNFVYSCVATTARML